MIRGEKTRLNVVKELFPENASSPGTRLRSGEMIRKVQIKLKIEPTEPRINAYNHAMNELREVDNRSKKIDGSIRHCLTVINNTAKMLFPSGFSQGTPFGLVSGAGCISV